MSEDQFEDEIEDDDEDGGDIITPSWMTGTEDSALYDQALDPTRRIRFLTTNGPYDAPVTNGQTMTLAEALTATGLRYNNASVFEMDGSRIAMDTILQPGAQIVAINAVKGG